MRDHPFQRECACGLEIEGCMHPRCPEGMLANVSSACDCFMPHRDDCKAKGFPTGCYYAGQPPEADDEAENTIIGDKD